MGGGGSSGGSSSKIRSGSPSYARSGLPSNAKMMHPLSLRWLLVVGETGPPGGTEWGRYSCGMFESSRWRAGGSRSIAAIVATGTGPLSGRKVSDTAGGGSGGSGSPPFTLWEFESNPSRWDIRFTFSVPQVDPTHRARPAGRFHLL